LVIEEDAGLLGFQLQAKQVAEALARAVEAKVERERDARRRAEESRVVAKRQAAFRAAGGGAEDSHFDQDIGIVRRADDQEFETFFSCAVSTST
jgi:hypothetical protein